MKINLAPYIYSRITDDDGSYALNGLPLSDYVLTYRAVDYLPHTEEITLDEEGEYELNIAMLHSTCKPGIIGCMNGTKATEFGINHLYRLLNFISGGAVDGWHPQRTTSDYGKTSSIDDYADSFAYYVLNLSGNPIPNSLLNDSNRQLIINQWPAPRILVQFIS